MRRDAITDVAAATAKVEHPRMGPAAQRCLDLIQVGTAAVGGAVQIFLRARRVLVGDEARFGNSHGATLR